MKKKLLIGGGLVALVAVIAVIAVFGNGGNFFKGSVVSIQSNFHNGPDFYVDETGGCAVGNDPSDLQTLGAFKPLGSKECPFKEIQEAVNRYKISTEGFAYSTIPESTIYVAAGNYDPINVTDAKIKFKGGYNKSFTSNSGGLVSRIDAGTELNAVSGEISRFEFIGRDGNQAPLLIVVNRDGEFFDIYNNTFTSGGHTTIRGVTINGYRITLINNSFIRVKSTDAVLYVRGWAIVKENSFHKSYGGGTVIKAYQAKVFNNLITDSFAGTPNVIYAESFSKIAHNTLSGNVPSESSLKIKGCDANIYNNLIDDSTTSNSKAPLIVTECENPTNIKGNGIAGISAYAGLIRPTTLLVGGESITLCTPNFARTGAVGSKEYYKLGENSTCVNKGKPITEVLKDAFGNSRQGLDYDPGFHEAPFTFKLQPLQQFKPL